MLAWHVSSSSEDIAVGRLSMLFLMTKGGSVLLSKKCCFAVLNQRSNVWQKDDR